MAPLDPRIVDRLTPTDVAAMLGLDLEELVKVVPFDQMPFRRLEAMPGFVPVPGAKIGGVRA